MLLCEWVKPGLWLFFSDLEENVKVDGVACLEKIIYKGSPRQVFVFLHLKPQVIKKQCVIDIKSIPRNDDDYGIICTKEDVALIDKDKKTIMQIYDTDRSPIRSIWYLDAE